MFEKNKADNESVEVTEETIEETPTSPVDEVNVTKIVSERIKGEKVKIQKETKHEMAKSLGYETWEDFQNSLTDTKLLDRGFDPESARPLLKEVLQNDPDYIELKKYKEEREILEQAQWAETQLTNLNTKFGTSYKDVSELDEKTIELWQGGVLLENAFAAYNYEVIEKAATQRAKAVSDSKKHMQGIQSSGGDSAQRTITDEELDRFKRINPDKTEKEIREFMNRRK